jgi:ankyrin repeat protein
MTKYGGFIHALEARDIEEIKRILAKNKAWVNTDFGYGVNCPLQWAARLGEVEIARVLCDNGADVNLETCCHTALTCACYRNESEIVRFLIHSHANLDHITQSQETALSILLQAGANVNIPNKHGQTPLWRMCRSLHKDSAEVCYEFAELLIDHGADVNHQDERGRSPLYEACFSNFRIELLQKLIDNGADPNLPTVRKDTPLMLLPRVDMMRVLLEGGANVNVRNEDEQTALIKAAPGYGKRQEIELLIDFGACRKSTLIRPRAITP